MLRMAAQVMTRGLNDPRPVSAVRAALPTLSDEELLRLTADENQAAMQELVSRYQAPIYRFLLRLMGSPEDAEEAAMDVFLRMWKHAGRFQYRAKVATWLYRIAVNIARDVHARRKSRPQEPWPEEQDALHLALPSAEEDALVLVGREQARKDLWAALERLSEKDRTLLILYYLEDKDYDEIQSITGLSYTVLKTRLARARNRLRMFVEAGRTEG